MTWMGRVRLIIGEGTCEHYEKVEFFHRACTSCGLNFLSCPICWPSYCPVCIAEMGTGSVEFTGHELALGKAKKKASARFQAWKLRNAKKTCIVIGKGV